jgi:hypothetical protein
VTPYLDWLAQFGVSPALSNAVRAFHLAHPNYFWQKDEQDYPRDDSDIEANDRRTAYPWEPK